MTTVGIRMRPARADEVDELFDLMMAESAAYIYDSLESMQISEAQFAMLFKAVGDLLILESENRREGFCWIEQREQVLHIHALIIEPDRQGQGLGSQAMTRIIEDFGEPTELVEVGVHKSNERALALSHKFGFVQEEERPELGFVILRKRL